MPFSLVLNNKTAYSPLMIGRIFHRPYSNHQQTLNNMCLNMISVIPINNVKIQTIIHINNALKNPSFLHIIYRQSII
jgi:hypothetical protein